MGLEQVFEGVLAFESQDFDIGEPELVDVFADATHPAEQTLNTKEIAIRVVLGHFDEEGAIATTEVNFQGVVIAEDVVG